MYNTSFVSILSQSRARPDNKSSTSFGIDEGLANYQTDPIRSRNLNSRSTEGFVDNSVMEEQDLGRYTMLNNIINGGNEESKAPKSFQLQKKNSVPDVWNRLYQQEKSQRMKVY